MRRSRLWLIAAVLAACSEEAPAPPAPIPVAPPSGRFGHVRMGDLTFPVEYVFAFWDAKESKLKIALCPTELTDRVDIGRLLNDDWVSAAQGLTSPDPARWKWYPMARIDLGFNGSPSLAAVETIHVGVYGVGEKWDAQSTSWSGPNARKPVTALKLTLEGPSPSVELTSAGEVMMIREKLVWTVNVSVPVTIHK